MVYVALSSVRLKRNPIKKARFMLYATRRLLQADEIAVFAATNSVDGQFYTMTVWHSLEEMVDFQQSGLVATSKSTRNLIQEVGKDSVFYAYETSRVPEWDEAIELLKVEQKGGSHSVTASEDLMPELCQSNSWKQLSASFELET